MDYFNNYINHNSRSGVSGVVFGANRPVLEVELNEMQEIGKESLRNTIVKICGDGITDLSKITYENGILKIAGGCSLVVDGILINCNGLSYHTYSDVVYLQVWEETVGYNDTLLLDGNQQSDIYIDNYIKDIRANEETTRRKVIKYTLANSLDETRHNLAIAVVYGEDKMSILVREINLANVRADLDNTALNLEDVKGYIGMADSDVYGVEIDWENNTYTRLGANVGLNAGADFDNIAPWGGRRRCILTDEGIVLAYYGDTAYTETGYLETSVTKNGATFPVGTPVQVMVEQPKFWYKTVPVKSEKIEGQEGLALTKARYYVSPTPRPGFKLFPVFSRGIPSKEVSNAVYFSAFRGSIYDSAEQVREEQKISIDTSPTSAGTVIIVPDMYADERIEVEVDTSMTTDNLLGQFKRAIDNYQSNIISTYGSFSNNLLVRYNKAGPRSLMQIDTGDTGMVCTVSIYNDVGSGGYVESDAPVPGGLTGCSLSSIAGVKPASGGSHDLTRYHISQLCQCRNMGASEELSEGFGWQQIDIAANMCTAYLFLIEYGSLDAYREIGQGASDMVHHGVNQSIRNGTTSGLGNTSGSVQVQYSHYPYSGNTYCVSYRGEENLWGNGSYYEEGINVITDTVSIDGPKCRAFVSTTGIYSDNRNNTMEGYKDVGFCIPMGAGYIDRVGYSENFDWGFLPARISGSSNYPIHDYFTNGNNTGWRVSYRANFWDKRQQVGLNSRNFSNTSSQYHVVIGGRLMFIPDPYYNPPLQYG